MTNIVTMVCVLAQMRDDCNQFITTFSIIDICNFIGDFTGHTERVSMSTHIAAQHLSHCQVEIIQMRKQPIRCPFNVVVSGHKSGSGLFFRVAHARQHVDDFRVNRWQLLSRSGSGGFGHIVGVGDQRRQSGDNGIIEAGIFHVFKDPIHCGIHISITNCQCCSLTAILTKSHGHELLHDAWIGLYRHSTGLNARILIAASVLFCVWHLHFPYFSRGRSEGRKIQQLRHLYLGINLHLHPIGTRVIAT
mmetsp:Transcript_8848/g.13209  ORF Transcript_8848/g.13209 Transcript_8848/m.13209 type:complete len:248 (+) Transcript_8848:310-1053(+)